MKHFAFILFFFIGALIQAQSVTEVTLKSIDKSDYHLKAITENKATVFVWLSPECPLCRNYTLELRQITDAYAQQGIEVYGIVAGDYFTKKDIKKYSRKYKVNFPLLLDPDFTLTNLLHPKITPEVVVLTPNEQVIYQGAIDNWAVSLGKQRRKTTAFYLKDALNQFIAGEEITTPKTEAIGCYIYAQDN